MKTKEIGLGRASLAPHGSANHNELHLLIRSLCGTYRPRSRHTTSIVLSEAGCVLGVKSALFHSTHLRHPSPRWWKSFTHAITRTQRTESDLFHRLHLIQIRKLESVSKNPILSSLFGLFTNKQNWKYSHEGFYSMKTKKNQQKMLPPVSIEFGTCLSSLVLIQLS